MKESEAWRAIAKLIEDRGSSPGLCTELVTPPIYLLTDFGQREDMRARIDAHMAANGTSCLTCLTWPWAFRPTEDEGGACRILAALFLAIEAEEEGL